MSDTNVKYKKKVVIGEQTLYLGDNTEILPFLDDIGTIITDPPYGINAGHGIGRSDRIRCKDNKKDWDLKPVDVTNLLRLNVPTIIWGGNYFNLPPTRGFLIWDKNNAGRDFADCELAWTNQDMNARIFVMRPQNMDGGKVHPTQKPLALMEWCITHLPKDHGVIVGPYLGSGTTLVACAKMGRKGIGIELDEDYFNIACKRVQEAYDSPDMFIQAEKKQLEQDSLL